MRNKRHEAILELISDKDIETQQELTVALSSIGFDVTQATVSRDIKELRLLKQLNSRGRYVYMQNEPSQGKDVSDKMSVIFSKSVLSVDYALNTVVIKTLSGMAQGAAAALDATHHPDFLGSIAGDDTIFVIARSETAAQKFCKKIRNMTL
ncbi:MAG: arginine repressor [Clostridia bacterium]|nr:arginine repressor [Clostridia bacterium]